MARSDSRLIEHAVKRPGALSAKAKRAGMSVYEYARKHEHDAGRTGDEARFYLYVLRPAEQKRSGT